jgi:hypothetical protein
MTRHVTCTTHVITPTCACKPKTQGRWHACKDVRQQDTAAGCCGICDHGVSSSSSHRLRRGGPCRVRQRASDPLRVCALHVASKLSHRGMFLNRASVRRHIAATKPCREANMGIREVLLEAQAGDVMAGVGGAVGPAPDVRHQPAGDVQAEIQNNILIPGT